MRIRPLILFSASLLMPVMASAEIPATPEKRMLTDADRMYLARQLLEKVKPALQAADKEIKEKRGDMDLSNLPEGEELFFRIRLTNQIALDYQLLARKEKNHLLISFKDFVDAVQFPIVLDSKTGIGQGWYIRENKKFNLDIKARSVTTDHGTFKLSDAVVEEGGDLSIPSNELGQWFGMELKPNVAQLEFQLVSKDKLPIQESIERHDRSFADGSIGPPTLPYKKSEQKMIDYPFVDVTTETRHARPGNGTKPLTSSYSNVRTAGDFAHGTLTTQSQFTKDERLTNVRATYKKESLEPELLGPLNARKFELGDITPVQVPINERNSSGWGARVTNKDALRSVTGAYTDITGTSIPGWDVELYRQDQLLGVQTVGDDARYVFPKVDLFGSDNTFRVVLYGLQGEVREEQIYIPVDPSRLAASGSAYDVSIVRQDTSTYDKMKRKGKDDGAPSLTALYEVPVGNSSAVSAGVVTRQDDGDQKVTGITGLSTSLAGALWNFNAAMDNRGETAGEIIARKDIGQHQLRNEMRVASDGFGYEKPDDQNFNALFVNPAQGPRFEREVFGNEFNVNGPLDFNLGLRPHYNMTLNYGLSSEGRSSTTAGAGFSTSFNPLSFNQQLLYTANDGAAEDTLDTYTNLTGRFGKNRVRLSSMYQIEPESKLKRVGATVNRYISQKMDVEGGVQHMIDPKYTEVSARLNWDTGYGNVSPGVVYNSDNDVIATLTTRFGLARDPHSGNPKFFDRHITTNGGVAAFVFLDKNGDRIFNEGDEPIPDAIIKAPQNGGRQTTDAEGRAFFNHMGHLRLTDVYVDPSSLADPYWIPAYEGASVLPREGHIIALEFPVHMSGELDGTVFAKGADGSSYPVKGVSVGLYDKAGTRIQGVSSEPDGFYVFSKIPPGSYYLVVDDKDIGAGISRPLPQLVTIGYEGTTVYANNIYMKQNAVDVPLSVLADGLPYEPEKAKAYEGRHFALNLGQYKSRLAMGLAWFKVRATSAASLAGTDLIEKPADSVPKDADSQYVLRVSVQDNDLVEAYKKCGEIVHKGNFCSVEILPGGLGQQVAARGDQ